MLSRAWRRSVKGVGRDRENNNNSNNIDKRKRFLFSPYRFEYSDGPVVYDKSLSTILDVLLPPPYSCKSEEITSQTGRYDERWYADNTVSQCQPRVV